jgi:hypothetical protein
MMTISRQFHTIIIKEQNNRSWMFILDGFTINLNNKLE